MRKIETVAAIEAIYGAPRPGATRKVVHRLTPAYRRWIEAARFCVLTTVGPEGTDGSPRGDDGPVVAVLDDTRLALPDRRGNNRTDSLRNIIRDGRLSLMFMVPGSENVVRVNGTGYVTTDAALIQRFEGSGEPPRTVTVIEIAEVYFQRARAIRRSGLWSGRDESAGLPAEDEMLADSSGP